MSSEQASTGGPYIPTTWALGGLSEKNVDIPITAVFLFLFMIGAATHMTIFQLNLRKGHKFLFSALLFGFCMARTATTTLRIASTALSTNISLAIAAQVFVAAGVVILYIVNLVFAQRIIRAAHPHIGWTKPFSYAFKAAYALVVFTIIILITVTIQSFFTLDKNIRRIDRDIQLYGVTMFAVLAFLPIPLVLTSLAIPRKVPLDKFGTGRWRTKPWVLLTGSTLIAFGASYRAGTTWHTPVERTDPRPAYDAKPAFYIVNFGVEIITVYLYAFARVDQRFHVHDGASSRKTYAKPSEKAKEIDEERGMDEEQAGGAEILQSRSGETFTDHNTLVDGRASDLESGLAKGSLETLPTRPGSKEVYTNLEADLTNLAPTAGPTMGKKAEIT